MPTFIPDGFTENGYLQPVPQLHDGLRFRYRPMLLEERQDAIAETERLSASDQSRRLAKVLEDRLVSWDLKDGKGQPVPLSQANIRRLQPNLRQRLANVVTGFDGGDADPQATAEQRAEHARIEAEADKTGTPPADVRDLAAVKN